ncbi:hypothetical protein [Cellulomonas sp. ES6]|uniref:hypothetical protein n=1 Tax=Cellulomonas sp. ES6 TaxID=3039384 RepID=UPI0024B79828|nr:hypothetical protein [Cellulomonas sp. ES6]WHP16441.1 hypothetical protein P9841_12515 [Cellulomonas sp. ES6]
MQSTFHARHLGAARIAGYLLECGDDLDRANSLYVWNAKVAGALGTDLGHLEVAVRNALDERMTARHARLERSGDWIDDPTGELGRDRLGVGRHAQPYRDLASAKGRVRSNRKSLSHGQVISETTFGLWHQLVSRRWSTRLWPDLAAAFPHAPNRTRETVADPVEALRDLRNRMSHHHRIWPRALEQDRAAILTVAGYIDPDLASWIEGQSDVAALLARRPA